jgi:Spy/CpxP family protein refolding chaperone
MRVFRASKGSIADHEQTLHQPTAERAIATVRRSIDNRLAQKEYVKVMSLRKNLAGAALSLGLIFALSAVAFAQQPTQQDNGQRQQEGPGRFKGERHGMGKRGAGGVLRLMSQLNLTDAQQQQLRAIAERFESSTKTQREEMRRLYESNQGKPSSDTEARAQALRAEIGQAMRGMRQEMLNTLTEEQRTRFEQLMKERKDRHEERRGGRGMKQQNDDNNQ